MTTAAQLIAALQAAAIETIEVRGVAVTVRGMTAGERIAWVRAATEIREAGGELPEGYWDHDLVAAYVVDGHGRPVFASGAEVRDALDAAIVGEIAEAILRKSGLRGTAEDAAKNS